MPLSRQTLPQTQDSLWTKASTSFRLTIPNRSPLFLMALCLGGLGLGYYGHSWGYIILGIAFAWLLYVKKWPLLIITLGLMGYLYVTNVSRDQSYEHLRVQEEIPLDISGTITKITPKYALLTVQNGFNYQLPQTQETAWQWGKNYHIRGIAYPLIPYQSAISTFDLPRFAYIRGILGKLEPQRIQLNTEQSLYGSLLQTSQACRDAITDYLSRISIRHGAELQMVQASLLGDTSQASEDMVENFKKTGTMHLFAVSGLHVGLIFLLVRCLMSAIGCSYRINIITTMILVTLYTYVTGMSISAMRACLMIDLWLLSLLWFRQASGLNIISFSFILFILLNPTDLLTPGFQLSFGIVALLMLSNRWIRCDIPLWRPNDYLPRRFYSVGQRLSVRLELMVRSTIVISAVAWLGSAFLTWSHFHSWTTVGAITNMAISPFIPLMMGCAVLSLFLFWCPPLATLCLSIGLFSAQAILNITEFLTNVPHNYKCHLSPAPSSQISLIRGAFQQHSLILGNPAWVIHLGSPSWVRHQLTPYLQHQGIEPIGVLMPQHQRNNLEKLTLLRNSFSNIHYDYSMKSIQHPQTWHHGQQKLTIYPVKPSSPSLKERSHVIIWEHQGSKLLYTNNASASALRASFPDIPKVDILIINKHPYDPILSAEWINQTQARTVITIGCAPPQLPSSIRTYQLKANSSLELTMPASPSRH